VETRALTPLDRLFLERAYELAARGTGNTAPNPLVGAVVVRDGRIVGEGYHHRAGTPHAEVHAIAEAGDVREATLYVSLEPCDHVGRTGACTQALLRAGVRRVVVGAVDPNPATNGRGIARLRESGVRVDVAGDEAARQLIEPVARAIRGDRPFVALKMAMSLDGAIAAMPGVREWLTGEAARNYVRELRVAYDAVMVGAGTVRVDDPQLTVRPAHDRLRPYVRIVACETDTVPQTSRVFEPVPGYERTIVLAPGGASDRMRNLAAVAEVVFVGNDDAHELDLAAALRALHARGLWSVLCEGGPTLAGRLVAAGLADRLVWVIAPLLLASERAVPVLAGADLAALHKRLRFDLVERVGDDVVLSGTFDV